MFIKGATLAITTTIGILIGVLVGQIPMTIKLKDTTQSVVSLPMPTKVTMEVPPVTIVSETTTVPVPEVKPTPKKEEPKLQSVIPVPDRQMRYQNIAYLKDQYRLSPRETVTQVNDIVLQLAMNAFFECRGEGQRCMAAVTHVVINRLNDDRFPRTVKDVLIAPGQYSWKPAQKNITRTLTAYEKTEVWADAVETVYDVLQGKIADPTKGSLYFCNPRVATVKFCQNLNKRKKTTIGNHVFG